MRVLLDECVDRRLAKDIVGHDVETVPSMGWAGKRNGELLHLAAIDFDVFVTVDQKLPKQHDVANYDVAVIVLIVPTNRLVDLRPLVSQLLSTLTTVQAGQVIELS